MGNTVGTISWKKNQNNSENDEKILMLLQTLQTTYGLYDANPNMMEYNGNSKYHFGVEKGMLMNSNVIKSFLYDAKNILKNNHAHDIKTHFEHLPM